MAYDKKYYLSISENVLKEVSIIKKLNSDQTRFCVLIEIEDFFKSDVDLFMLEKNIKFLENSIIDKKHLKSINNTIEILNLLKTCIVPNPIDPRMETIDYFKQILENIISKLYFIKKYGIRKFKNLYPKQT